MQFDLEDLEMWEPVLFGATSKKQLIDAVTKRKAGEQVEETIFKQEVWLAFFFFPFLVDISGYLYILFPLPSPLHLP